LSIHLNATTSTPPLHITGRNATPSDATSILWNLCDNKKLTDPRAVLLPLLWLRCIGSTGKGFWSAALKTILRLSICRHSAAQPQNQSAGDDVARQDKVHIKTVRKTKLCAQIKTAARQRRISSQILRMRVYGSFGFFFLGLRRLTFRIGRVILAMFMRLSMMSDVG